MRKRVLWLLALAMVCTPPALARVGSSYRTLRGSGFAKFFNLTVRSRKDLENGGTLIRLEPGSYQKQIDILVTTNRAMETVAARLSVARSWIGGTDNLNSFAKDLVKSFVADVSCDGDNEGLKKVVAQIWHATGSGQEVIQTAESAAAAAQAATGASTPELEVFLGKQEGSTRSLKGCTVNFSNVKVGEETWLRVSIKAADGKK